MSTQLVSLELIKKNLQFSSSTTLTTTSQKGMVPKVYLSIPISTISCGSEVVLHNMRLLEDNKYYVVGNNGRKVWEEISSSSLGGFAKGLLCRNCWDGWVFGLLHCDFEFFFGKSISWIYLCFCLFYLFIWIANMNVRRLWSKTLCDRRWHQCEHLCCSWLRMDCKVYLQWIISLCMILWLSLQWSFKNWRVVGVVVGITWTDYSILMLGSIDWQAWRRLFKSLMFFFPPWNKVNF